MKQLKKWWRNHRETIFARIIQFKLRFNRGSNWTGFFTGVFSNVLLYVGMLSIIIPGLSGTTKIILVFISLFIFWFQYKIGEIDEKRGLWKAENQYAGVKLNPWVKEIQDDLKKIKDKLDIT